MSKMAAVRRHLFWITITLLSLSHASAQTAGVLAMQQNLSGRTLSVTINILVNNPAPNPSIHNFVTLFYVPLPGSPAGASPFSVTVSGFINGAYPFYTFTGGGELPPTAAPGVFQLTIASFLINSTTVPAQPATSGAAPPLVITGSAPPFATTMTSYAQTPFVLNGGTNGTAQITVGLNTPSAGPQCTVAVRNPANVTSNLNLAVTSYANSTATLTALLAIDTSTQPTGNYQVTGLTCTDLFYGPLLTLTSGGFPGGTPAPIAVSGPVPFSVISYGPTKLIFTGPVSARLQFRLRLQSSYPLSGCSLTIRRPDNATANVALAGSAAGTNLFDAVGFYDLASDSVPNGNYEVTAFNCTNTGGGSSAGGAGSLPGGAPAAFAARRCLTLAPVGGNGPVDLAGPTLHCLAVDQPVVDVSAAEQTVRVQLSHRDGGSGIYSTFLRLTRPNGVSTAQPFSNLATSENGEGQFVIPRNAPAGAYLPSVELNDFAGNRTQLDAAALSALGFPGTIQVVSNTPDTTGPVFNSLTFNPGSVVTSGAGATAQLAITGTDNQSGLASACITLVNPASAVLFRDVQCAYASAVPTPGISTLTGTMNFVRQYTAGTYTVASVDLTDQAGNTTTLAAPPAPSFVIVANPSDDQRPRLTAFDFSPKRVDTSAGSAALTANLSFSDDVSGFSGTGPSSLSATSTSGRTVRLGTACTLESSGNALVLHPRNVTYRCTLTMPPFAEQGYWNVSGLSMSDARAFALKDFGAGLSQVDLAQLGFPTLFYNGPATGSAPDGFIGAAGGAVTSLLTSGLTFAAGPNLFSTSTGVSLAMIAAPANLPVPQGYAAAGLPVVTVGLTPALTVDLAAPGASLTLPVPGGLAAGTALALFRIDPLSNALTPALAPGGLPIVANSGASSVSFAGLRNAGSFIAYQRTAALPGDINTDGLVNCTDYALLRGALGKRVGQPGYLVKADLNSDGVIDVRDLTLLIRLLPAGLSCN